MIYIIILHSETEDYERYDVPSITLSDDNRTECTRVTITPDLLVEGRETFQVIAEADEFNGSYAVNGSDTVTVTILDNNSKPYRSTCTLLI